MEFEKYLLDYDRENIIKFTKEKLESGYGVVNFYNDYIFKSLELFGNEENGKYDIAKEHLCSAIIRSVIEVSYEYVVREKEGSCNKKVVVCSLQNELHELPPRIINDFFTLKGFDTYFLGVNIPSNDILDCVKLLESDYIAISITNFLHLTKLTEIINKIKSETNCKIIIGGLAVSNNLDYCKELGADYVLSDFSMIGGILDEISD